MSEKRGPSLEGPAMEIKDRAKEENPTVHSIPGAKYEELEIDPNIRERLLSDPDGLQKELGTSVATMELLKASLNLSQEEIDEVKERLEKK